MQDKEGLKAGGVLVIQTRAGRIETKVEKVSDNSFWVLNISGELEKAGMADEAFEAVYIIESSIYLAEARVKRKEAFFGGLSLTQIVLTKEPVKSERRESYRLQQSFDLHISKPDGTGRCKMRGLDISDTGIGFISKERYQEGEIYSLEFSLGEKRYLLMGEIVRNIPRDDEESVFQVGIRFIGSEESIQKNIRRYIYMQQAAKRK